MKILVTGGLGYIGSHTVVSLVENGFTPIIIDNCSNATPKVLSNLEKITGKAIPFYQIDITNLDALHDFFTCEKIDGVIHFAGIKAVGESVKNPVKYYHNNLTGLTHLLLKMQEFEIHHLIFSSSCTIYGDVKTMPIAEHTPSQKLLSPYANTKKVSEEIIADVASIQPLRAISLRYFNPIGAHPSALIGELPLGEPQNLLPIITQVAIGKKSTFAVYGNDYDTPDGTCVRDYIHVVDIAEAHVIALQRILQNEQEEAVEVFNLGSGTGYSVLEIIRTFEKVTGVPLSYTFAPRRPGDLASIYADTSKVEKTLGWKATRSLEEALESAWNWQKNIPQL